MKVEEFKAKYGTKGASLMVATFIERSPDFNGDEELAIEIGTMMADLESVLREITPCSGTAQEGEKK